MTTRLESGLRQISCKFCPIFVSVPSDITISSKLAWSLYLFLCLSLPLLLFSLEAVEVGRDNYDYVVLTGEYDMRSKQEKIWAPDQRYILSNESKFASVCWKHRLCAVAYRKSD